MSISITPAIDLRNGRCVRLSQGRKDNTTIYDGDPIDIAVRYVASGAEMIHLVDLDGAFSDPGSRNRQVLREIISQTRTPLQFGGGFGAQSFFQLWSSEMFPTLLRTSGAGFCWLSSACDMASMCSGMS